MSAARIWRRMADCANDAGIRPSSGCVKGDGNVQEGLK